jgi:hypothetical protein
METSDTFRKMALPETDEQVNEHAISVMRAPHNPVSKRLRILHTM